MGVSVGVGRRAEDLTLIVSPVPFTATAGARCTLAAGAAVTRDGVGETLATDTDALLVADTAATTAALLAPRGTEWTRGETGRARFATGTSLSVAVGTLPLSTALTADGGVLLVLTADAAISFAAPIPWTAPGPLTGTPTFVSAPPEPDLLQRFLRTEFRVGGAAGDQPYDDLSDEPGACTKPTSPSCGPCPSWP